MIYHVVYWLLRDSHRIRELHIVIHLCWHGYYKATFTFSKALASCCLQHVTLLLAASFIGIVWWKTVTEGRPWYVPVCGCSTHCQSLYQHVVMQNHLCQFWFFSPCLCLLVVDTLALWLVLWLTDCLSIWKSILSPMPWHCICTSMNIGHKQMRILDLLGTVI